jgi:ATP-binding cassette subfamily C protein LapB
MKGIELDKEELVLLRRFAALVGLKVSTAETREAILSSDKTDAFERVNDALTFIGLRVKEVKPNLKAIEPSQAPFLLVNERGVINLVDEINDEYVIVSSASGGSRKKQKRSEFNTIVSSRLILAERNLEPKTDTRERLRLLNLFSVLGAGNFAWIAVATGMSNVLSLASSLFIMVVYDRILPNQSLNSLYALSVGVALAILFDFLLKEARQSIISRVTNASDHKLNAEIYEQYVETINDMRSQSVGALSNTMRDYENYKDFVQNASLLAFIDIPFILIFVWVISMIGGALFWVPLLCIPVVLGSVLIVQPLLLRLSKNVSRVTQSRQSQLLETLNGLDNIRISNVYALMRRRFLRSANEFSTASSKLKRASSINTSIVTITQQAAQVLIIIFGFLLFVDQQISMGAIIATVILTGKTLGPLAKAAQTIGRANTAYNAYLNLKAFFAQPRLERKTALKSVANSTDSTAAVSNVTLRLAKNSNPLFSGLSVSINAGEKIAVIGRTGAGKTTLLRLISGLVQPEVGTVTLAGQDIRSFSRADIAERLGVAFQDSWIFSGSVRENITLGDDDIDDDQILEAIKLGGGAHSIGQVAEALDTEINDGGTNLSGGQKQSICLARVLVRNPDLYLLDEPTSAMDAECEQAFLSCLTGKLNDKAMMIVTHKPSILSACERVIVMQQGNIAWNGSLPDYKRMVAQRELS